MRQAPIDLSKAVNGQELHSGTLCANGSFTIDLGGQAADLTPSSSDNDVLDGGYGNDVLHGRASADTFGFASHYGRDTIMDFGAGDDLYVANWKAIGDLGDVKSHADEHGRDLWISAGHDTLIIKNFEMSDLRASMFEFG